MSLQEHRRFYANFIVKSAGSSNEKLIAAFEATEREHYLGDGPWSIFVNSIYISTVSSDPRLLYQDIVVGLATDRRINNGQPTCLRAGLQPSGSRTGWPRSTLARSTPVLTPAHVRPSSL
jgi:hypothetical protein